MIPVCSLLVCLAVSSPLNAEEPDPHTKMLERLKADLAELNKRIIAEPDKVELYSRRGDALFFLGRFNEAVADYEKTVVLNPKLETSHWRRGIAYFYAKDYKKAAHQFEIYDTFDNVDRENGIWRYFSQFRAYGKDKARKGLLKYEKDDREPFPSVYKLFSGDTTPEAILKSIADAEIDETEREKRNFYAQLYIGLNHALEGRPEKARTHLKKAVANTWGPKAGYGPRYMWQVGRLHLNLLESAAKNKKQRSDENR
jgi:lipoprotein NlpI